MLGNIIDEKTLILNDADEYPNYLFRLAKYEHAVLLNDLCVVIQRRPGGVFQDAPYRFRTPPLHIQQSRLRLPLVRVEFPHRLPRESSRQTKHQQLIGSATAAAFHGAAGKVLLVMS